MENLIINAWMTFTEYNDTTVSGLFTYPAEIWAGFIPLTLFALFTIVMFSTYFSQRGLTGTGDFKSSFAVAGFFVAIISLVMTMVEGLIGIPTVVICITISIIGVLLLLPGRDR